jgi:hypothetical protein
MDGDMMLLYRVLDRGALIGGPVCMSSPSVKLQGKVATRSLLFDRKYFSRRSVNVDRYQSCLFPRGLGASFSITMIPA